MTYGNYINGKPAFNPAEYGLSNRFNRNSQLGQSIGCYMRSTNGKDNGMALCLNKETGQRIISKFGERVNFDFDKNGSVFVWSGEARKLSSTGKGNQYTISMDIAKKEYVSLMGKFKRLYLNPEFHETHVEFKQSGKRD